MLDARAGEVDALWSADPLSFIESEQAGLLGHMVHPTPKSRWGMDNARAYAPESQAHFALQWLAVDPALVEHDSATGTPAAQLTEALLRDDPAVDGAALDAALADLGERVLLPVHPWELAHLRDSAPVSGLIADGRIVELGELGSAVTPTASMRTVYNADWPWQLTFTLHAHMTDEMRLTPVAELEAAVAGARAFSEQAGAAAELAPDLAFLQDPAYLSVTLDGTPVEGLSVQLRENRWGAGSDADVSAVEVLVQDHPFGGASRVAQIVAEPRRAERPPRRGGRPRVVRALRRRRGRAAAARLRRARPVGPDRPAEHAARARRRLAGALHPARDARRAAEQAGHETIGATGPGFGEGPFLDNALGVINALGVAGHVEEIVLLGDLKALLARERERGGEGAALLGRLLDDATWPCKAKMRTRLHNDVDRYVQIPNPLHGVRD